MERLLLGLQSTHASLIQLHIKEMVGIPKLKEVIQWVSILHHKKRCTKKQLFLWITYKYVWCIIFNYVQHIFLKIFI